MLLGHYYVKVFSLSVFCSTIMQNAVIYYLLFCEKYLLMNGAGYGYIHLLQFFFDQFLIFFL